MVVTAAVWLVFVLAAVRPPFRRGPLGFAVFVMTLAFNELPLLLLVVFGLAMALTGFSDGWPGVALAGVTALGLIWLQLRARTARPALEVGLGQALGRTPWWRGMLLPFQRRSKDVVAVKNVAYGPESAHRLDLYRGPDTPGRRPVLIHLHGGGFVSGRKSRESMAMIDRLAAHGWLCLSADYRLRADGVHPNPLDDTVRVIDWIKENADEFGADPSRVFLAGCSAGGHLAVSAALTAEVAGAVVLYGYLGPRTPDPSSSPASLARPDAPPMLLIHGANDTAVPVADARAVADALRRTSHSPVLFIELPHTQHSFDRFASVRARTVAAAVETFLDRALLSRAGWPDKTGDV